MTATDADQIDALLDAILTRAAERAAGAELANVAGAAVVEGRAAGRVTVVPGESILSAWGNLTFDQSAVCFATTAERDSQWANPHPGAVCYTEADAIHWFRNATAWVAASTGAGSRHAFRGWPSAYSTSATPSTATLVKCNNAPLNHGSLYNPTTGLYTCPEAGLYQVSVHGQWLFPSPGGYCIAMIYRNGVDVGQSRLSSDSSTGGYACPVAFDLVNCAAGDTLAWWCQSNIANMAMRCTPNESYMTVVYLGPVPGARADAEAPPETHGFMVQRSTPQATTNNGNTVILFDAVLQDTDLAYNASAGKYIIPAAGWWSLAGVGGYSSSSTAGGRMLQMAGATQGVWSGGDAFGRCTLALVGYYAVGATIQMTLFQSSGVSMNTATGPGMQMSGYWLGP